MKLTITLTVLAALLVAGGGAYYYFFAFDEGAVAKRALEGDGSITCTLKETNEGSSMDTISIHDGNIRTSYMSPNGPVTIENTDSSSDKKVARQILIKDDTTYMWSEGEDYGLQLSKEEGGEAFADTKNITNEFKEKNYSCSRMVDEHEFEVQNDVEFLNTKEFYNKAKREREEAQNSGGTSSLDDAKVIEQHENVEINR